MSSRAGSFDAVSAANTLRIDHVPLTNDEDFGGIWRRNQLSSRHFDWCVRLGYVSPSWTHCYIPRIGIFEEQAWSANCHHPKIR